LRRLGRGSQGRSPALTAAVLGHRHRWVIRVGLGLILASVALPPAAESQTPSPSPAPPILESVSTGGIETRAVALILSGQQGGDLASEAGVFPRPGGGVDLVLDVDGASLFASRDESGAAGSLPANPTDPSGSVPEPVIIEIYAYALDPGGGLRGYLTEAFRLEDAAQIRARASGGIKFLGRMALAPGDYSLRLLALYRRADRFSLLALPFTVPGEVAGPGGGPPFLVLEAAAPWVLVRQPERGQAPPVAGGPPWSDGAGWWVPAVHPVVAAGEDVRLVSAGEGPVTGRLLDAEDRQTVYEAQLVPDETPSPVAGFTGLRLPVAGLTGGLADDLEAGEYLLQLGGGEAPALALRLVAPGGEARPWFVADSAATAGPAARPGGLPAPPPASGEPPGDRAGLTRAYAEALLPLAGERPEDAVSTLADFERGQIGQGSPLRRAQLADAEDQIAAQALVLAGGDARVLLPLIWLHGEAYRGYHRRAEYLLAVHSRQQVLRLGELYTKRLGDPREARCDLAVVVSGMAGYLQEIGANLEAQQAFERGLELDGDNPAALLGLAVIHEAYGDYDKALELLGRLAKLRPESAEVRLRLGINLRRSGALRPAAETLESGLGADRPTWVRSLAFQELAALEDAQGRSVEAVAWLRRALVEIPGEQQPRLQLASLLDRLGRPAEATALVEEIAVERAGAPPTSRFRYSQWPRWALLEGSRRLEARVRDAMPELALAVLRMNRRAPLPGAAEKSVDGAAEGEKEGRP